MKEFHSFCLLSAPPKPIQYAVEGLIQLFGQHDISGPPGEGKSTIVLSLVSSISAGRSWFGLATRKLKVGWITGEASSDEAIGRDLHRLKVVDADIIFILPDAALFKFDGREQQWNTTAEGATVLQRLRDVGVQLLVLDTVGSVVAGSKEIDNDQQRQLARHLRVETKGFTVVTISHTNQSSAKDTLDQRLHYLSRAGGNGFPGAIRWAGGVSALQDQDIEPLGLDKNDIKRRLVAFGASKHNETPRPGWNNRTPAIFEIRPDGALVLFSDGRQVKQTEKKEARNGSPSF